MEKIKQIRLNSPLLSEKKVIQRVPGDLFSQKGNIYTRK
jgi:hypothetical protein